MIVLVERGYHHVSRRTEFNLLYVEIAVDDSFRRGEALFLRHGIVHRDPEVHQLTKVGQCFRNAPVAGDNQLRLRQHGFDVNVHNSPAGHTYSQDFVLHVQGDQLGFAGPHGFQCFTAD
jgi:hypothetical protein